MGVALAGDGRYGEALSLYGRVLVLHPRFAEAHNNAAIAYAQTGKLDHALFHFQEAIRARPDYEEAIRNLKIAEKEKIRESLPVSGPPFTSKEK